jgi:hypothetical protein
MTRELPVSRLQHGLQPARAVNRGGCPVEEDGQRKLAEQIEQL